MGIKKHPTSGNQESTTIWEKYLSAYYEKPKSTRTWSGLDPSKYVSGPLLDEA